MLSSPARNALPQLPIEIWEIIINYFIPSREDYAVKLPWKRSARDSTLVSLTQVSSTMRKLALPLVWAIVYVETMKDWGLLWKRISVQSGQYIQTFINFWAIARLPPLCRDHLQERGKDLLWYAFIDRKNNPLYDLVTGEKFINYDPYERLGNGPDGHGPDSVIKSREIFLQACTDISSTWSKRLRTIYWDASTTFPECVIINIRQIQESSVNDEATNSPGLEHLVIDYVERSSEEERKPYRRINGVSSNEHARRVTYFDEPIWKLGPVTLKKLKFFSLAPPFWPNTSKTHENLAKSSPSRLWSSDPNQPWKDTGKLFQPLPDYPDYTGPAQYYKVLQSIQPEVFFSTSQSPFHCKELLPCWARIRCIYKFGLVVMTNDDDTGNLVLPKYNEFFETKKIPDFRVWSHFNPNKEQAGQFLRGAIQLRPALERLAVRLGGKVLTGNDIKNFASADGKLGKTDALCWKEHWKFSWSEKIREEEPQIETADDLFSVYKEWLQDDQLADKVAQAYNEGVQLHNKVAYPFCHSESPGKVYFETSLCQSTDEKVWLDRPKHKGCYSHLNVEGFPKLNHNLLRDTRTMHRHLQNFPSYLPSI